MDLFVVRHAEAVPLGEQGITEDAERPLTDAGREQAKAAARCLHERGLHVDAIATSPLLRARQTADAFLQYFNSPVPELRECNQLAPGGRRRKLSKYLRQLACERVALVGHQPDLGDYLAWLIGDKQAQIDLAKGGIAYLVCDPRLEKSSASLVWLLTPEWMKG